MHPMFVQLFMETGADDQKEDEQDRRRAASRAAVSPGEVSLALLRHAA